MSINNLSSLSPINKQIIANSKNSNANNIINDIISSATSDSFTQNSKEDSSLKLNKRKKIIAGGIITSIALVLALMVFAKKGKNSNIPSFDSKNNDYTNLKNNPITPKDPPIPPKNANINPKDINPAPKDTILSSQDAALSSDNPLDLDYPSVTNVPLVSDVPLVSNVPLVSGKKPGIVDGKAAIIEESPQVSIIPSIESGLNDGFQEAQAGLADNPRGIESQQQKDKIKQTSSKDTKKSKYQQKVDKLEQKFGIKISPQAQGATETPNTQKPQALSSVSKDSKKSNSQAGDSATPVSIENNGFFRLVNGKKIELNTKGKVFFDLPKHYYSHGVYKTEDTKYFDSLILDNGLFKTKNGELFSGIMEFTNKQGELVHNIYKKGELIEVKKDSKTFAQYSTRDFSKEINKYNNGSRTLTTLYTKDNETNNIIISEYPNGRVKKVIYNNPNNIRFVEIQKNDLADRDVIGYKLIDKKTKKVIQEAHLDKSPEMEQYGFVNGALVAKDDDIEYLFLNQDLDFQDVNSPINILNMCGLPLVKQNLANGVKKCYSPVPQEHDFDLKKYSFSFPTGEEIWINNQGSIYLKENSKGLLLKEGSITKKPIGNEKGTARYIGKLYPFGTCEDVITYNEKEKKLLKEFLTKFVPDDRVRKFQKPLEVGSDVSRFYFRNPDCYMNEDAVEQFIDRGIEIDDIRIIKRILEFFKKYNV